MTLTRYGFVTYGQDRQWKQFEEQADGEYVKWADVQALLRAERAKVWEQARRLASSTAMRPHHHTDVDYHSGMEWMRNAIENRLRQQGQQEEP